ncbi:LPS export ABC transporter protein LptC [Orenia metallireducens]|jgi:LPS export ABC transporter protein LptC|uniref:LPS export ABC transporter protein LptC n=1 Tax=Orenia metallireducens TaxID=1413210 RepID=A0A285GLV5_9FIRM|nr:LPS export ABC transporter periplasmic protein LptC [Orenia metallireducens]PRX35732.1 LPS export ABC transporter protein LptC [Orenia metallireducens]SNY24303.1 LPS export ABC transporter protein LptC [Orenia metallireducens]
MKKIKIILAILFISLTFASLSFFYSNESQEEDDTSPNYQYQIDSPRVITYNNGDKRWDITANQILIPKDEDKKKETEVILKDIQKGELFNKGEVEYTLDAEEIVYFKGSKDIKLKGNIRLDKVDGEEIRTEKLDWLDKRKEFVTDNDVKVTLDDGELFAKKMRMDVENDIIDFSGNVEMEFELKGVGSDED